MTIKIEKNVPMSKGHTTFPEYPFQSMEVGDSFLVKWDGPEHGKQQAGLLGLAKRRATRDKNGHKYSTRQNNEGVRIWRTE